MALPTPDKTWQFDVNQTILAGGTVSASDRNVMLAIKNALIGFGSNPWTVVASSNGASAGAGDKWIDPSDLTWATAGNPHSWIQLRQTGIAANFELIIDLASVGTNFAVFTWSPTGFDSAGSINNRPTSSTGAEVTIVNADFKGTGSNNYDLRLHVMQSTDGQCTRIFSFDTAANPRFGFYMLIDRVKNPVPGWTVPAVSMYDLEASNSVCDYSLNTNSGFFKGYHNSRVIPFYATTEFYLTDPLGTRITVPNDIDGSFPLSPIGLYSDTSGVRGRHGQVFDLWWGSTAITQYAGSYPEGTARQLIHFGNMVNPWNGSPMLRYGGPF